MSRVLNFLHKTYLVRFQLLAGSLLVLLPLVEFSNGGLKALFGGLLDVTTFGEGFFAICFAYFLSFSAVITFRIAMLYGPERCGFPENPGTRWIETVEAAQLLFAIGLALPVPLIVVILTHHFTGWRQVMGIIVGTATALAIVFLVDLVQRLFNTFHTNDTENAAKRLFFPFDNALSRRAERAPLTNRFFSRPIFNKLNALIDRLGRKHGVGYFTRTGKTISVKPGIVLATIMFAVFLGIYGAGLCFWTRPLAEDGMPMDVGVRAITYLFVVMTLLCWLLSGLAFHFDRHRIPIVLIILIILAFADLRHTYDVTHLGTQSDINFAKPFELLDNRKGQDYIIFVTANGGGIQSSAWAAEVLTRFQKKCADEVDPSPNGCQNSIALMSGISGGSVGVMYYMGAYDEAPPDLIRQYARRSSLEYVAGGLVFNDFIRNIPLASLLMSNDRGKHLARGWAYNRNRINCDRLQKTDPTANCAISEIGFLSGWRKGVREGVRPGVVFNSTALETGKRVLFSTVDFHPNSATSKDWMTLQQLAGTDADMRVTEAVRLSAGFPYVSPAAKMADPPERNDGLPNQSLADGGYYDNYGLLTVRNFLEVALQNGAWSNAAPPKVLIIQILGEKPIRDPGTGEPREPTFDFMSWFDQTLSPLTALLRVRGTSQYERNDEAFQAIQRMPNIGEPERFIFEFPDLKKPIPLSWHLTSEQKRDIDKASETAFAEGPCNTNEPEETPWPCLKQALEAAKSAKSK